MSTFAAVLSALKAAGEPTRLRLMAALARAELTVTELTQVLGQSQPRISRHLKLLCDAGLIERFREGAWAFYRLADKGAGGEAARFITQNLPADDPALRADHERLSAVRRARQETAAAYFKANAKEWARIRALHVPEADVEAAVLKLAGEKPIPMLLDLGTGTGRMLEVFAPHVERGLGIDLSREMLGMARANLEKAGIENCSVRHGDLYRLPFESGAGADVAVIHQVLHYLENPAAAVAEAARVLKPGGRIVIADFAPHDLEFLREAHAHRRLGFADTELKQWAEAAGLHVTQTKTLPGDKLTVKIWLLTVPAKAGSKTVKTEAAR